MAWETMQDLTTGDIVTEADMDAIRGNIEYLLEPNSDADDSVADFTTTSTSFVDVGAAYTRTVTSFGGPLLILFTVSVDYDSATYTKFEVDIDGSPYSGNGVDGIAGSRTDSSNNDTVTILIRAEVDAGAHTIKLQWRSQPAGTSAIKGSENGVGNSMVIEI